MIEVNVDPGRYRRSGASGYYVARVTDPITGEVIGKKGSIAVRVGEVSEVKLEVYGSYGDLTD